MQHKRLAAVVGVVVCILVLAGCGSDSDDVPSLRTAEDAQAVDATATADAADGISDNEARMMAFTQCLRDQGIEMYDPVVDADGNVQKPEFAEGVELAKSDWAAFEACDEHLAGFSFEKERVDVSAQVDQWVAIVSCLRDKDYDVDEPTPETLDQWLADFKFGFDWKDPRAVDDYEECSSGAFGVDGRK
jgi:hypothetical protein